MLTVGMDVHQQITVACVLDRFGKEVWTRTIRGGWSRAVEVLAGLDQPFQVCFEASCGYGPLHDALSKIARRVIVAHPGQVRLIFRSKQKHDRADARKLATLLYLRQVPPVHVPSADVRGWRALIEHRRRLIDRRTKSKNGLRAALRSAGLRPPRGGHWAWTKQGVTWLAHLELPSEPEAWRRDMLLAELEHFELQTRRATQQLDRLARRHPGVTLLMTIPGVGPRTAEAIVAYIDDPSRFARIHSIGSYFGLVPCQDQSAGRNHLGRITKNGPATVRRLLIEAAWSSMRWCSQAKAYCERIMRGDRRRRKIAVVALAHKLLRMMLAMLRTGEVCRWAQPA
jgi:transposase